jgi:tetratricopeptide (TPR) repeat protein
MLCRDTGPATLSTFRDRFSRTAYDWVNQPLETARAHLKEGREEAALSEYREALARQPDNWVLLAEAARFVSAGLHEHEAALALARRALALNPASAELWSTAGDCLVFLDRLEEAEQSFLEALRLNPRDAGPRYSLVHILMRRQETGAALRMIAEALIDDKNGEYRERLLQRQGEILGRMDHVRQQRTRMLVNRFSGTARR